MTQEEVNVLLGLFDVLTSLGILGVILVLFLRGDIVPFSTAQRLISAVVEEVLDELRKSGRI